MKKREAEQNHHPLEIILAKELKEEMTSSRFIAFFHRNTMSRESEKLCRNNITKKGFRYRHYNRLVYKLATQDTTFSNISDMLFTIPNTIIVMDADEDRQVNTAARDLLMQDKKMPGFVLMFAFAEDRFLRKDEIVSLSQMSSIDSDRGKLVSTLSHTSASLSSVLCHHQAMLSLSLQELSSRGGGRRKEEEVTTADTTPPVTTSTKQE